MVRRFRIEEDKAPSPLQKTVDRLTGPESLAELTELLTQLDDDVPQKGSLLSLAQKLGQELSVDGSEVRESIDRRSRVLEVVQEALAQLRLDIKYLTFEIDCTRQERDEALEQLGDR